MTIRLGDPELLDYMTRYIEIWHARDSVGLARDYYRMGMTVDEHTREAARLLAELDKDGYDRSQIHELVAYADEPQTGRAGMKLTRRRHDGSVMEPAVHAYEYELRKFADGWRITSLRSIDPDGPLPVRQP